MKELRHRSVIKALSWRILATLTTIALVYLFTGTLTIAFGVGLLEMISKIILYYFHERVWNQMVWGIA